jgi:DEAD/DEAH box helicase
MASRMAPPAEPFSGFFFHGFPRPTPEEPALVNLEPGQNLPPISEDAHRAYRMIFLNEFKTTAAPPPPRAQPPRPQQQQQVAVSPANSRQQQAPLALLAPPAAQPPRLLPQQPPPQQQMATLPPPRQQQQQSYQPPPATGGGSSSIPSLPATIPAAAAAPPPAPPQGPLCSHGVPYTSCSDRADHLQQLIGQLADLTDKFVEVEDPTEMAQLKQQWKELRELRKLLEDAPPPPMQRQQPGGHASEPAHSLLNRQYSGASGAIPPAAAVYPPQQPFELAYPPQQQQQQQQQQQFNQPNDGSGTAPPGAYQQPNAAAYTNNNGSAYPTNQYNNGQQPGALGYPSTYQPLAFQQPGLGASSTFGAGAYNNNNSNYNNNGGPPPAQQYSEYQQQGQYQQQQFEEFIPYEPDRVAMAMLNTNVTDASVDPQWQQENFDWSLAMKQKNTDLFGNAKFRHTQLSVLNATMAGRDAFVLMPTGGGKSLCYQLPAVLSPGVTLVISPLTSLIQDQVSHLEILGIPSVSMTGAGRDVKYGIARGDYKVVFLTPERLFNALTGGETMHMLQGLYNNRMLARVVVDEAHCVSNWGHGKAHH